MSDVVVQPRTRMPGSLARLKPLTIALGMGLGAGMVPAADAATYTVSNLANAGAGSLRQAVLDANGNAGLDTVNFTVTGTISLATEISITEQVTITGPGAASMTLTPSSANRALYVSHAAGTTTISGLTIQGNGTATVIGAGIYHRLGTLVLQNTVFNGNITTSSGGALFNYGGPLDIQSSTFTGNGATDGGMLYNHGGDVTIQSSTITGNTAKSHGGAIIFYYTSASLIINDSIVSGNTATNATGDGGAIYFDSGGNLTIRRTTLAGNKATNDGGAISLHNSGRLTIEDSTLSGNTATDDGGAIELYASLPAYIRNSTLSGNSAGDTGGAIYLYDGQTLNIINSTLTGNQAVGKGGAIYLYSYGTDNTLNLISTIVANSSDSGGTRDIFSGGGSIVNATNSLITNLNGFAFTTDVNNVKGVNPLLGPLANNGGPTQTHGLFAGSPALNKGSNPDAQSFDQRGTGFPRTVGGLVDIGAFEGIVAPSVIVPVPAVAPLGLAALSALLALLGLGGAKRRRRSRPPA